MSKKTTLVVCRRPKELSLLSHVEAKPEHRYVVASDDIRVQEAARRFSWVDDVCWIEQMESRYVVADDVLRILEVVNDWLGSLAHEKRAMPAHLLFWPRHIEGGMTSQRIQDVLLLIRSYLHLFESYAVGRVVIPCAHRSVWEDDVLIETARARDIAVQRIAPPGHPAYILRWGAHTYLVKPIAKVIYEIRRILIIIRAKLRRRSRRAATPSDRRQIVFQLGSSEDKHIENIAPLMKALRDKGYEPLALTWQADRGADKIREEALHAAELEAWIPVSSFWETPYRVFHTWQEAKKRMGEFLRDPKLQYQSVQLGPLLWPAVERFLTSHVELSTWHRLDQAAREYFRDRNPVAARLWGGASLPVGIITRRNLHPANRPFLFSYSMGVLLDNPYFLRQSTTDLILAPGRIQKEYLLRKGAPSERIVVVGHPRYDHLEYWMKTGGVATYRSRLNIPSKYDMYIFYDPAVVLRGYVTAQEQVLIADTLLSLAQTHPTVALITKPHPSHQPGMLEQLIDRYALDNVFLLQKDALAYDALAAADLVVTKFSTVGIEAMLLGRPIISITLDNEERWRSVFGDAAEYVMTTGGLDELLKKLVRDPQFRAQWAETRLERQEHFLKQYFVQRSQPASLLAASIVCQHLEEPRASSQARTEQEARELASDRALG